jgi:hypothetical protein
MYRAIDFGNAAALSLATDPLSSRLVQVRIRWALRNKAGAPLYEFDAMYTLARHSDIFRITAVAHNEMAQYRRLRGTSSGETALEEKQKRQAIRD